MSLVDELLRSFEHVIEQITLVPSDGGKFEVSVNEKLVYSKRKTGRHAAEGEIVDLVTRMVEG